MRSSGPKIKGVPSRAPVPRNDPDGWMRPPRGMPHVPSPRPRITPMKTRQYSKTGGGQLPSQQPPSPFGSGIGDTGMSGES